MAAGTAPGALASLWPLSYSPLSGLGLGPAMPCKGWPDSFPTGWSAALVGMLSPDGAAGAGKQGR